MLGKYNNYFIIVLFFCTNWSMFSMHNGKDLFGAIRQKNIQLIKCFIGNPSSDINARMDGFTPLLFASYRNYLDAVKLLVSNGADVDCCNNTNNSVKRQRHAGCTALIYAVERENAEMVAYLLANSDIDVNKAKHESGDAALHVAVKRFGELQKQKEAFDSSDPQEVLKIGDLFFVEQPDGTLKQQTGAKVGGNAKIGYFLLEEQDKIFEMDGELVLERGHNPELQKKRKRVLAIIIELVNHGAFIDLKNNEGKTSVDLIKEYGIGRMMHNFFQAYGTKQPSPMQKQLPVVFSVDVVKQALSRIPIQPNVKNADMGKQVMSCVPGTLNQNLASEALLYVKDDLANKDGAEKVKNQALLIVNAQFGNLNAVKEGVDRGANIDIENPWGHTGLYNACKYGHFEIVRFLVEHGACICKADKEGISPIQMAYYSNAPQIISYLEEKMKAAEQILCDASVIAQLLMQTNRSKSGIEGLLQKLVKDIIAKRISLFDQQNIVADLVKQFYVLVRLVEKSEQKKDMRLLQALGVAIKEIMEQMPFNYRIYQCSEMAEVLKFALFEQCLDAQGKNVILAAVRFCKQDFYAEALKKELGELVEYVHKNDFCVNDSKVSGFERKLESFLVQLLTKNISIANKQTIVAELVKMFYSINKKVKKAWYLTCLMLPLRGAINVVIAHIPFDVRILEQAEMMPVLKFAFNYKLLDMNGDTVISASEKVGKDRGKQDRMYRCALRFFENQLTLKETRGRNTLEKNQNLMKYWLAYKDCPERAYDRNFVDVFNILKERDNKKFGALANTCMLFDYLQRPNKLLTCEVEVYKGRMYTGTRKAGFPLGVAAKIISYKGVL